MKAIIAGLIIAAAASSAAQAKTIAIYDEALPHNPSVRLVIALSDMPMRPEECDGETSGGLAMANLTDWRGEKLESGSGCWIQIDGEELDIIYIGKENGKWKRGAFDSDKFQRQ